MRDWFKALGIGFIGAGKVGTALGQYLTKQGLELSGYFSLHYASAKKAAALTSTNAYDSIKALVAKSAVIFITTPDDQIQLVWEALSLCDIANKIICHMSGALSSAVFSDIEALGAYGYSIHPIHAFSNSNGDFKGMEEAYFTLEGSKAKMEDMRQWITSWGNSCVILDQRHKTSYHAANVMVSNLVLALIHIGCQQLTTCGWEVEDAKKALFPLIVHNLQSIDRHGFVAALTGPIERNDTETVQKHLAVLPTQYENIYRDLSLELVRLAKQKHPKRDYEKMQKEVLGYEKDDSLF